MYFEGGTMKTKDAISYFGGTVKLAKALGIAQPAVSQWGEEVPLRRAHEINQLTNGELKVDYIPNKVGECKHHQRQT